MGPGLTAAGNPLAHRDSSSNTSAGAAAARTQRCWESDAGRRERHGGTGRLPRDQGTPGGLLPSRCQVARFRGRC